MSENPERDFTAWRRDQPTDGTSLRAPELARIWRWVGLGLLRLFGWRVVGQVPAVERCVVVAAPHTSNLDGLIVLATLWAFRVRGRWVVKAEWVRGPLGPLLKALGAVALDRDRSRDFVGQMVDYFARNPRAMLVIAPEGTRKKAAYWKSGFYHIAQGAGVPLLLSFCDYRHKRVGVWELLEPSGDIEADMAIIRAFYGQISGRYPDQVGEVRLRPYIARETQAERHDSTSD